MTSDDLRPQPARRSHRGVGRPRRPRLPVAAATRLVAAIGVGVLAGLAGGVMAGAGFGFLVGMTVVHATFVAWGWAVLWPLDATTTRDNARRQDFDPAVEELVVVLISVSVVVGMGILLALRGSGEGKAVAGIALLAVFLAWGSVQLMYAGRYAYLYYLVSGGGGIDFNDHAPPAYRDFFYFSYNLGMTYQVSDTAVSSPEVRSVVLRHCLLSYVFGVVVLASTINLVASIATG